MSKWNWPPFLHWVAAAGLLAIGGAGLLYENAARLDSTYHQQANHKASAYANRAREEVRRECISLASLQKRECAREVVKTAREGQHNEYDLEAQRSTANWTRHMGIAAIFGTAFGVIGVLLVLLTFRESKRTADAAAAQVQITREVAETETRPIMVAAGEDVDDIAQQWGFRFRWKNVGKFPARIIKGETFVNVEDDPQREKWIANIGSQTPNMRDHAGAIVVGGGDPYSSTWTLLGGTKESVQMALVYGVITYTSAVNLHQEPWTSARWGMLIRWVDEDDKVQFLFEPSLNGIEMT